MDKIPQLQPLHDFLLEKTGWDIRPIKGLLSTRDFISGFAYKVFFSTQYIRHHTQPFYTPEPDLIHELLGHVPILFDTKFTTFLEKLGKYSLGKPDDVIEKLGRIYWYTVEFGLCKSNNDIKIYGAGILSSIGEIIHCLSEENSQKIIQYDPSYIVNLGYPVTTYQLIYNIVDNFDQLIHLTESYIDNL